MVCVILVAFGYTNLPFWPQGRPYTAYFADAGGINPGNDVYVSGIKVGKVQSVSLAGDTAKVGFTVDRHVNVGEGIAGGDSHPRPSSASAPSRSRRPEPA